MRGNEGRAIAFGSAIRSLRRAFGLSQAELGLRVGRSQAFISAVEAGDPALRIDMAAELCDALGATLVFGVESRLLSGSERQRDAGHARCSGHVVRRLVAAGWLVNTEVQIGTRERPGWIDVLAFHPTAEILLVIEVKTELLDVGAVDRQLGWYEREAIVAARRFGWRPRMVAAALLLLATEEVDRRLSENRVVLGEAFPGRAADLERLIVDARVDAAAMPAAPTPVRFLALIDPHSRARRWLRPSTVDGRRSKAPFRTYADFVRAPRTARPGRLPG
jgi:transcriptional regulator with XRE-family HTH domain